MKQTIGYVAVVVEDYDEAITFYVDTLGFSLIEDTFIEAQNKRWLHSLFPTHGTGRGFPCRLDCSSIDRIPRRTATISTSTTSGRTVRRT